MKRSFLTCLLICSLMALNTMAMADEKNTVEHKQNHSAHQHDHATHQHTDHQETDHQHDEYSDETVSLGAHVHGHAVLTLVLEGNEMQLAFQSAAQSIVGFEYKPSTSEQKQEVAAAIAVFNQGEWFSFNSDANCELAAAEASTDLTEMQTNEGHADFYANYQLLCQRPARLSELKLRIFELIPALEYMDIQWIINGRQGASKAALSSSTIRLQ